MEFELSGTPFLGNLFSRTSRTRASDSNLAAHSSGSSVSVSEFPPWYQKLYRERNGAVPTLMKDFKGNDEALHTLAEAIFDLDIGISDTNRKLLIAASQRWLRGDSRFSDQIDSSLRRANERPIDRQSRRRQPRRHDATRSRSAEDSIPVAPEASGSRPAAPPEPEPPDSRPRETQPQTPLPEMCRPQALVRPSEIP